MFDKVRLEGKRDHRTKRTSSCVNLLFDTVVSDSVVFLALLLKLGLRLQILQNRYFQACIMCRRGPRPLPQPILGDGYSWRLGLCSPICRKCRFGLWFSTWRPSGTLGAPGNCLSGPHSTSWVSCLAYTVISVFLIRFQIKGINRWLADSRRICRCAYSRVRVNNLLSWQ